MSWNGDSIHAPNFQTNSCQFVAALVGQLHWALQLWPYLKNISVHDWIGQINEEFRQHLKCEGKSYETLYSSTQKGSSSLLNCITGPSAGLVTNINDVDWCKHCCRFSHKSDDCWSLIKTKCKHCGKAGHLERQCRQKRSQKRGKETLIAEALTNILESHVIYDQKDDAETLTAVEDNLFSTVEPIFDQVYNNDYHYAATPDNDTSHIYCMTGSPIPDQQHTSLIHVTFSWHMRLCMMQKFMASEEERPKSRGVVW